MEERLSGRPLLVGIAVVGTGVVRLLHVIRAAGANRLGTAPKVTG